jgi:hypothetical protein
VAEARRAHARAYERWTDDEDARLRRLIEAGGDIESIVAELQRQPNAVIMRAQRLSLDALLESNAKSAV